jgi:hypothetical protein
MKRFCLAGAALAIAASFGISSLSIAATKQQTQTTQAAHVHGKSRAECHRIALVNYPDPRSKAHQDAMARCMAGQ